MLSVNCLVEQARRCLVCRLFVEIAPGTLGLVRGRGLKTGRYGSVVDWEVGDLLDVKVLEASLSL